MDWTNNIDGWALVAITIVGGLLGIITALGTYIFNSFKTATQEHIADLNDKISELHEQDHILEKKILEYQVAASSTFLLKDDFRDYKDND